MPKNYWTLLKCFTASKVTKLSVVTDIERSYRDARDMAAAAVAVAGLLCFYSKLVSSSTGCVTPTSVTPTSVTPTSVTPTSVTPTCVTFSFATSSVTAADPS